MDVNVKTADTGYLSGRPFKGFEDPDKYYDGTVRPYTISVSVYTWLGPV